jgi:hypothetical protein
MKEGWPRFRDRLGKGEAHQPFTHGGSALVVVDRRMQVRLKEVRWKVDLRTWDERASAERNRRRTTTLM